MNKTKLALCYVAIAIFVFIAVFPIFWLVSVSFKSPEEWVSLTPTWLPLHPTLDNYIGLFQPILVHEAKVVSITPLINSALIAGGATILATFVGFLAIYSLTRFSPEGTIFYLLLLTTRMSPGVAMAIPLYVMYSYLGLLDSHLGLILVYSGVTMAYVVWMTKGFVDQIPRAIEESAIMDGMSQWGVLFKVTLPLVKGGLIAAALFVFVLDWGDFFMAVLFTYSKAYTVPIQIFNFSSTSAGIVYGAVASLSLISLIPVLIFGYIIQKHLVAGLTFGAVRGH